MPGTRIYIDGFNFYYGVTEFWRDKKEDWAGLGWCDFRALIERHFLPKGPQLDVKYFTARVREEHETPHRPKGEHRRYDVWSRAVRTIPGIRVIEGIHKRRSKSVDGEVRNTNAATKSREEKQSDINLAIEVMIDVLGPEPPSKVFLLSDDRDLMPVVFALLERLPKPIATAVLLPSLADEKKWKEDYNDTAERLVDCGLASRRRFAPKPEVTLLKKEILANSLLRYKLRDHGGEFECLPEWQLKPSFLDQYCRNPEWRPTHHSAPDSSVDSSFDVRSDPLFRSSWQPLGGPLRA